MQIVSIDALLGALKNNRGVCAVRESHPEEEPDFVQEHDKLCTGITMKKHGEHGFSCTFDPPVYLKCGVGYKLIDKDGQ